jgi:RHS repeat-associated protein
MKTSRHNTNPFSSNIIKSIQVALYTVLSLFVFCLASSMAHAQVSLVYYHNDALGSPVAATDEAGEVLWREDYAPYGKKLADDMEAVVEKVGYTGHRYDSDTGLVYAGARMYDPSLGRFMGIDPVGALAAVNNPMMTILWDIYGHPE